MVTAIILNSSSGGHDWKQGRSDSNTCCCVNEVSNSIVVTALAIAVMSGAEAAVGGGAGLLLDFIGAAFPESMLDASERHKRDSSSRKAGTVGPD